MHVFKGPCIDRLSMVRGIWSKNLYKHVYSQLYGFRELQETLVPDGKITVVSKAYCTRMCYYPTKGRKIADVILGATKSQKRYFMVTLYPPKFRDNVFDVFKQQLGLLIPDLHYGELYETANVSNIEIAIDSSTDAVDSVIPVRLATRKSNVWSDKGELGTTYLGSHSSRAFFKIYDKRKQLEESGEVVKEAVWARYEATVRKTGLVPSQLVDLPNPFLGFFLVERAAAFEYPGGDQWHEFLNRCILGGSASALAAYPKRRTQFKKNLAELAAKWWDSEARWKGYPKALSVISP